MMTSVATCSSLAAGRGRAAGVARRSYAIAVTERSGSAGHEPRIGEGARTGALKSVGGGGRIRTRDLWLMSRRKDLVNVRHLGEPRVGPEKYVKTRPLVVAWEERKAPLPDDGYLVLA